MPTLAIGKSACVLATMAGQPKQAELLDAFS